MARPNLSCFPCARYTLPCLGLAAWMVANAGGPVAAQENTDACTPSETQQSLLEQVNKARSQPRDCGTESFEAAEPLVWNCTLEDAARSHSEGMVEGEFFGHAGAQGQQVTDRVSARGYKWRLVGENIASGQSSVEAVMEGWLSSPGHCANIMKKGFTEMGAARVEDPGSLHSPFWTQVFARPR